MECLRVHVLTKSIVPTYVFQVVVHPKGKRADGETASRQAAYVNSSNSSPHLKRPAQFPMRTDAGDRAIGVKRVNDPAGGEKLIRSAEKFGLKLNRVGICKPTITLCNGKRHFG